MRHLLGGTALAMLGLIATAQAQDPAAHDKLAAAFVAALPPSNRAAHLDEYLTQRSDALARKYPAKAARARTLFGERQTCSDTKGAEITARMILTTAKSLSDEDLRSLTAFYSGPDYARMESIKEGSPEWDALLARYPLKRFADAMQAQAAGPMVDDVFEEEQACDATLAEALAKEGMSE